MMAGDRERPSTPRKIDVRVSETARSGWDKAAREHGVTLSALIEAIGCKLDNDEVRARVQWTVGVWDDARAIDEERRAR